MGSPELAAARGQFIPPGEALEALAAGMRASGCLCLYSRCSLHGEGMGILARAYVALAAASEPREALEAELRGAKERVELARQRALLILSVARQAHRPEKERLAQIEGEAEHFCFIAVEGGVELDAAALRELIGEVEAATEPFGSTPWVEPRPDDSMWSLRSLADAVLDAPQDRGVNVGLARDLARAAIEADRRLTSLRETLEEWRPGA